MRAFNYLSCAVSLFALSSCVTAKLPPEPTHYVAVFDYSTVSQMTGVGFTESDAVSFDYEAIASISFAEVGGFVKTKELNESPSKETTDDIYAPKRKKWDHILILLPMPNKG